MGATVVHLLCTFPPNRRLAEIQRSHLLLPPLSSRPCTSVTCVLNACSHVYQGPRLSTNITPILTTGRCALLPAQQEGTLYDYENPAFSPATRHFTQNVWRRTTHVGFGFGSAVDQYGKYWVSYVVAKFFTPGNAVEQFEGNVLPPVSVSTSTHSFHSFMHSSSEWF